MNTNDHRPSGYARRGVWALLALALALLGGAAAISGAGGMFLATNAVAGEQTAVEDAATTAVEADLELRDVIVDPAAVTEAPASDPAKDWVFTPDPLESVSSSLREREQELERRERAVADAEAQLEALRKEVEAALAQSRDVLAAMERTAGEADTSRKQELSKWVKIYQAMKPAQAGPVLAGLDQPFALQILSQMDPKGAGKILDAMDSESAIELGKQLGLKHP